MCSLNHRVGHQYPIQAHRPLAPLVHCFGKGGAGDVYLDLARRLDDATVRYLPWRLLVTQLLLSMLLWLLGLLMWLRLLMLLVLLWRNCCLLLA